MRRPVLQFHRYLWSSLSRIWFTWKYLQAVTSRSQANNLEHVATKARTLVSRNLINRRISKVWPRVTFIITGLSNSVFFQRSLCHLHLWVGHSIDVWLLCYLPVDWLRADVAGIGAGRHHTACRSHRETGRDQSAGWQNSHLNVGYYTT